MNCIELLPCLEDEDEDDKEDYDYDDNEDARILWICAPTPTKRLLLC